MKVLLVSGEYPPHIFGGGATFMYFLSTGLVEKGVDVTVLAMDFSSSFNKQISLSKIGEKFKIIRAGTPSNIYPRHTVFQFRIRSIFSKLAREHDIVHINTGLYYPFLRKKIAKNRMPVIVTVHGDPITLYKIVLKSHLAKLHKIYGLLHMSESHIGLKKELSELYPVFVSRSLYETLNDIYKIRRFHIIYNGIDFSYINRVVASEPTSSFYYAILKAKNLGYKILVYPARFHPIKNHLNLIRVFRRLVFRTSMKVLLVLVGDGPMKKEIFQAVHKTKISKNVIFTGKMPYDETLRILSLADAVPIPSLYEAHPISMIESLYLNKPIITFDLPFSREVKRICNRSCNIKFSRNLEDFFKNLLEILNENSTANKKIVTNVFNQFSKDFMVNEYYNLYLYLMNK